MISLHKSKISWLPAAIGPFGFFSNPDNLKDLNFGTIFTGFILPIAQFLVGSVWVIALIALMITGLKYITAQGNKAVAEENKKSFIFILIGVLVVTGALAAITLLTDYLRK